MKTSNKLLLLISLLISTYTLTFAQTDLENEGLKGAIKTVSSTVYRSTMKEGKIKLLSISQVQNSHFNKAGYLLRTEYQINSLSLGEGPKRKIIYVLDKKNKLLKATNYKEDAEGISTQYVYKNGQIVESKYYEEGDEYLGTEYATYDANGNKLSSNSTDPDGNSLQKSEFTYTSNNKLASSKKKKGEKLVDYKKYEYPNKKEKKTIDIETETEEEIISSYTIDTYDEHQNRIGSIEYTPDGKVEKTHLNQYNEQGDISLRQVFDAKGKEETYNYMRYEYLYDEKGNWTQKVEFLKNGNSLDAVQREIEYYKSKTK